MNKAQLRLKKQAQEELDEHRKKPTLLKVEAPSVEAMINSFDVILEHLNEDLTKSLHFKRLRRTQDYRHMVRGTSLSLSLYVALSSSTFFKTMDPSADTYPFHLS